MQKLRKRKLCDLAAIQPLTHCQALLLSKFGGKSIMQESPNDRERKNAAKT